MNKPFLVTASIALALVFIAVSCQTTKEVKAPSAAEEPAASSIATESRGFSPNAAAGHNSIDLSPTVGNPEAAKAWKVEMQSGKSTAKTFSGSGSAIPAILSWDGRNDAGKLAPEGEYTARLSIDYGEAYKSATASSSSFVLDISPPTGKLLVSPDTAVPAAMGFDSPISIRVEASSALAGIDSWSLDILDPQGRVFRSYSDKWPRNAASWDGLSSGGTSADPRMTYKAVAKVRDEFGNEGSIAGLVPVGDVPAASGATFIEASYAGFAPKGQSLIKTMDFTLALGQKSSLKSWKIEFFQVGGGAQKTIAGDATNIPASYSWDGMKDTGFLAPEGRYVASLSVDYGSAFKPATVKSREFVLDLTPPSGTIVAKPDKISPAGAGAVAPMSFSIIANSEIAPLADWTLSLDGTDGRTILSAAGKFPKADYSWDGKLKGGAVVNPSTKYSLTAKVSDIFGNTGVLSVVLGASEIPVSAVSIAPRTAGFSPNGDSALDRMEFSLSYGQPQAVRSWKVEILKAGSVQRTLKGEAGALPSSLFWDGKKEDGSVADEGNYAARLSVDYDSIFKPATAMSAAFVLDLSPPQGEIRLSEPLFSPIESNPTISLTLDAKSPIAGMDSWSLKIYDPAGNLFRSFDGRWPNNQAVWDGKSISGEMVESAEDYSVTALVRDEFGNSAELKTMVPVDILVEKTAAGYRILSSRIFFKPFTSDFVDVAADLAKQNLQRLDQLATKLKKFPQYKIKVVGHAVMINWNDPAKGRAEQAEVLLPLSASRAEAVKKAMMDRGFDAATIAAEGVGASDQLVPDSDLANRWRNRRVAFFLERP